MSDIEAAKELLKSFNCAAVLGGERYTSVLSGIRPAVELAEGAFSGSGFSVADKIVGKAAAMLFFLAGADCVYGGVMSRGAASFLAEKGVRYEFGVLADEIVNRAGDGICPMENAVKDISEPRDALRAVIETLGRLKKKP